MFAIFIFVQKLVYVWTDAIIVTLQRRNVLSSSVYFCEYLHLQHIVLPHQIGVVATLGCKLTLMGVSLTDSSVEDATFKTYSI